MKLEDLAKFCQKKRAYKERDRAWELLLDYQPDHKDARKALGYSWDKKAEEWTRKRAYKEPKNADNEAALEALEQRKALLDGHKDALVKLLVAHRESLTEARFRAEVQGLLTLAPDDARLRGFLGQVKSGDDAEGEWVLTETRRAIAKRKELRALKKELRANAPEGEAGEATETEKAIGLSFPWILSTGRIRVLCTGTESEARDALESCDLMCTYATRIFGGEFEPAYTVYMIDSNGKRDQLLDNHPGVEESMVEFLRSVQGGTLTWGEFGQWGSYRDQRVDGAVRQVLGRYMTRTFRTTDKNGWVHEGFGMYLTYQLIGTRLTFYIRPTEYVDGETDRRKLTDPDSDWLKVARGVLEGAKSPNLPFTLGRDVNTLTTEDLLASYALAAFLIEGHEPALVVKILTRIGDGDSSIQVLEEELGYDHETLKKRLIDWLDEQKK